MARSPPSARHPVSGRSPDDSTRRLSASRPRPTAAGTGWWPPTVASSASGTPSFYGSTGSLHLNKPIVGMASTPNGKGYWLVASDGGIFSFGDAAFHGSMGGSPLNQPVVGMADDPATGGYWEVAADGGIFSYTAPFFGSTGSLHLNRPIVGMETSPNGQGYRFVASDGGIFTYGQATFDGSTGNIRLASPVVGMAPDNTTNGYWMAAADGGIFTFGGAAYMGRLVSSAGYLQSLATCCSTAAEGVPPTRATDLRQDPYLQRASSSLTASKVAASLPRLDPDPPRA